MIVCMESKKKSAIDMRKVREDESRANGCISGNIEDQRRAREANRGGQKPGHRAGSKRARFLQFSAQTRGRCRIYPLIVSLAFAAQSCLGPECVPGQPCIVTTPPCNPYEEGCEEPEVTGDEIVLLRNARADSSAIELLVELENNYDFDAHDLERIDEILRKAGKR